MASTSINRLKRLYWGLRSEAGRKSTRQRVKKRSIAFAAYVWRRLLFKTTFIAISGSVGKTTTKEFLCAILEKQHSIILTPGGQNTQPQIEAMILKARPWHRFAVVEVGVGKPGDMRSVVSLLKPDIALLLAVKLCHTNTFKTLEAIAEEKSQLLLGLGRNGCAVVNSDDPRVAEIASNLKCQVVRFGSGKDVDLRVRRAESRWPSRLTMEIESNGAVHEVATRLVGTQWTPTILAALATAMRCGVSIEKVIATVGSITPFWARMQPITLPSIGATVVRDEWNGSIDTFEPALKFMEDAVAPRKVVVFSDYSDSKKKLRIRANHIGKAAARVANVAVFVGEYAERSAKAAIAAGLDASAVRGFFSILKAIEYLREVLDDGDLVLIKGQTSHHLSRVFLGLLGEVSCSKLPCSYRMLCDGCPELGFEWRPELSAYMEPPSLSADFHHVEQRR